MEMLSALLALCEGIPFSKGQQCGTLVFALLLTKTSCRTNSQVIGNLSCYDVCYHILMVQTIWHHIFWSKLVQIMACCHQWYFMAFTQ